MIFILLFAIWYLRGKLETPQCPEYNAGYGASHEVAQTCKKGARVLLPLETKKDDPLHELIVYAYSATEHDMLKNLKLTFT